MLKGLEVQADGMAETDALVTKLKWPGRGIQRG